MREISVSKTEVGLLKRRRKCGWISTSIDGQVVEEKSKVKYLGIGLDERLAMGRHVEYAAEKIMEKTAALAKTMPNVMGPGHSGGSC